MDYEEEEQYEEMQAEPQAEVIEIDAEDAPYLDLRDDRERQGYAILKNKSFVHIRAFVWHPRCLHSRTAFILCIMCLICLNKGLILKI